MRSERERSEIGKREELDRKEGLRSETGTRKGRELKRLEKREN